MKCTKCGIDNTGPQARFCRECGTPLAPSRPPAEGGTVKKRLCDGCMGAFNSTDLFNVDGRELCTLCQQRETRQNPGGFRQASQPYGMQPETAQPMAPAGAPPAGQQGYYYDQAPARRTTGWAVASIILAFFFPLAAVVAGIVALRRIKDNPEELEGKGLATAGIALGTLGSVMAACIITAIVLTVVKAVDVTKRAIEETKAQVVVSKIVASESRYFEMFGRHADVDELVAAELLGKTDLELNSEYSFEVTVENEGADFVCRATPRNPKTGGHLWADKTGRITYDETRPAGPESIAFQQRMGGFGQPQPVRKPVRVRTSSG